MFEFLEFFAQGSYDKTGTIEINQHYYTARKPAWLVLLKVCGTMLMVAVGCAIAVPTLLVWLPLWQSLVLVAGGMLIYTGIAFFLRPEPNPDNMGIAGGLINDPFQYSDDLNRSLWDLHCVLGPGRFAAETLLDVCVCCGLAGGEDLLTEAQVNGERTFAADDELRAANGWDSSPDSHVALDLRPDEQPAGAGRVYLSSERFLRT